MMSAIPTSIFLAISVILALNLCGVTSSEVICNKPPSETPENLWVQKEKSEVSVVAVPDHHYQRTNNKGGKSWYVDVTVKCVFKGTEVPERITLRIDDVGEPKGIHDCIYNETSSKRTDALLLFLKKSGSSYILTNLDILFTDGFTDEMKYVCNHTVDYPIGRTKENTLFNCGESSTYTEEECYKADPNFDETDDTDTNIDTDANSEGTVKPITPSDGASGNDVDETTTEAMGEKNPEPGSNANGSDGGDPPYEAVKPVAGDNKDGDDSDSGSTDKIKEGEDAASTLTFSFLMAVTLTLVSLSVTWL